MTLAIALQSEPLDALCWRMLGSTAGIVEQALGLTPGLADLGPLLPAGTAIQLPAAAAAAAGSRMAEIALWD
jgi:phage tail protein X